MRCCVLIATIRDLDAFHPDSDDLTDLEHAVEECTGGLVRFPSPDHGGAPMVSRW